jgi:hypothetical protein
MEPIDFDTQVPFSFDPARLHLFDVNTGESVLRPGVSTLGAKSLRGTTERLPSLVPQSSPG